jgi:hypothetical protein
MFGGSCLEFRCLDVGAVEVLVSVHESDRGELYKTIIWNSLRHGNTFCQAGDK